MRDIKIVFTAVCLFFCLTACSNHGYEKFTAEFDGMFDTVIIITGFEKSREDFDDRVSVIRGEMLRLHKLFDIYNDYEGINNVKTINDNAGITPVKVDEDLLELIELGVKAYDETDGAVNIALGSVLKIWHEYRDAALKEPKYAAVPAMDELKEAAAHTDIDSVIIDRQLGTVYLKDSKTSLDLGALAKGYAVELASKKACENGFISGIISAGGNIRAIGKPMDGREEWRVGVQNPFASQDGAQLFDTLGINKGAVISSGSYQRFYVMNNNAYHHIIDPKTLMPSGRYSGVTVIHPDSGVADMLSTALFILPQEQGKQLSEQLGGEAIWIFHDKTYQATDGYKKISKLF